MTMSTSLPLAPVPIRCCPKACEYRPEAIEHFLAKIEAFRVNGEDVTLQLRSQQYDQDAGGGTVGDEAVTVWDVEQAVRSLVREGRPVTAITVAGQLCPWSLEE